MGLNVYNNLTRKKEEFKPLKKGKVGIYVCGPTVYGHAHLGHAKSYVSFDILVRYLRYLQAEMSKRCRQAPAWRSRRIKERRWILRFGKRPNQTILCSGRVPGGWAFPDGTWSAR